MLGVEMDFTEKLKLSAKKNNSITCVGIDPILEKIPLKSTPEIAISRFFCSIIDGFLKHKVMPAAIKPNIAFFEQYGFEGLRALKKIVEKARQIDMPVIIDAKRGDIGKTARAYAKAMFDVWGADATTLSPFMGQDSLSPFIEYSGQGKGMYVLNKTSNAGSVDFQDIISEGKPLFLRVSEKIVEWHKPGVGAVVGAIKLEELAMICEYYHQSNKDIPLLIPGVGAQGGSASDVSKLLRSIYEDISLHRINSSSSITYAYLKDETTDYVKAAVDALKKLNLEIGDIRR